MRNIRLASLSLVNFKGIRSLEIQFSERDTVISGRNGTGKTTVMDAFLWLLFGKDSTGRSDSNFSIKTIDAATGKAILRLDHSVTGVLVVDGEEIRLQRCFKEKWVKSRGTTEETLQNHYTEFYVDDVKLGTKKEYEETIASIIPEDVFKMVTTPYYFTSLKPEVQKNMLLDMAGGVADEEVAALNPDCVALLARLSGRSLAQFAKEVAAKKRACKDVIQITPSQIETAQRLMPEEEDWSALEAELAAKKQKVADIDSQIADKSKIVEAENQRKVAIQKQIGEKKIALTKRENEIRSQAGAATNEATLELNKLEYKLRELNNQRQAKISTSNMKQKTIDSLEQEKCALRAKFKAVSAETIQYPEGAFVCPTCKRPLDMEDMEAKQAELLANFNAEKARKQKAIRERGQSMAAEQEKLKAEYDALQADIVSLEQSIAEMEQTISEKKENMPTMPDVNNMVASDQLCIDLKNEIVELENQLNMEAKQVDVSELTLAKRTLNDNIRELDKRLAKREYIERAKKEIANLEEKRIQNTQALADLEKWEFTALSFQKDKDAKLIERINGLFKYVSFSFVDEQLNGGEKLTCVCTVNGTPYPDVNAAGKLNGGLDIINAICQSKGVTAPIFIDNRESVNQIIPTLSQVVNLVVNLDENLTIQ